MLPNLYPILRDDAGVAAIVSGRVYRHGSAPEPVTAPYVTWFVVSGTPENNLTDLPPGDRYEIQVDCWSDNAGSGSRGIDQLAEAVRDALEPYGHMTAVVADEKDAETKRFRIGMQFTFWALREPGS